MLLETGLSNSRPSEFFMARLLGTDRASCRDRTWWSWVCGLLAKNRMLHVSWIMFHPNSEYRFQMCHTGIGFQFVKISTSTMTSGWAVDHLLAWLNFATSHSIVEALSSCIHTYKKSYIHACRYACMLICRHMRIQTNIHAYIQMCIHAYMYTCMYAHVPLSLYLNLKP